MEIAKVVKPEWGTKRACQKCRAHFYDLQKDPIICPKCNSEFQPEILKKRRRSRTAVEEDTSKSPRNNNTFVLEEEGGLAEESEALEGLSFEQDDEDLLAEDSDLVDEDEDMGDMIDRPSDNILDKDGD